MVCAVKQTQLQDCKLLTLTLTIITLTQNNSYLLATNKCAFRC